MRVAVVHYHYRPGGVTRVVENAFESIQGRGIAAVAICGEPYDGDRMAVRVQQGLGYSQPNEKLSPGPLWYALRMTARQALGGEPDLWHFHNHALGKNSAIAEVVDKLAATTPVLLQLHDFAEDGRPGNYAMLKARMDSLAKLYPQGPQVHYAAINARDRAFMRDSGFRAQNVHLLPNPVDVPCTAQSEALGAVADCATDDVQSAAAVNAADAANVDLAPHADFAAVWGAHAPLRFSPQARGATGGVGAGQKLYLYPTRAIRRKNLGELLLWAALNPQGEDAIYATTLEPEDPQARLVYERWVALAQKLALPIVFGVGQGSSAPSFARLVARADAVLTTSVAEGFGLAFVEPWLFGKRVLGRNLPEITADFAQMGINLDALYTRLMVPLELVSLQQLRHKLGQGLERVYDAYGRTLPIGAVDACLAAACDEQERVDFGLLDEELQEQVITGLVAAPYLRSRLSPATLLPAAGDDALQGQLVAGNRAAVQANLSPAHYGQVLADLYATVAASPKEKLTYPNPDCLLDKYLAPERFSLLRS